MSTKMIVRSALVQGAFLLLPETASGIKINSRKRMHDNASSTRHWPLQSELLDKMLEIDSFCKEFFDKFWASSMSAHWTQWLDNCLSVEDLLNMSEAFTVPGEEGTAAGRKWLLKSWEEVH
jgi:hypothetical protein